MGGIKIYEKKIKAINKKFSNQLSVIKYYFSISYNNNFD